MNNNNDSTNNKGTSPFEMEKNRPECTHYERNCTIIAPCCGLAFGCRICHDEYPNLPMVSKNHAARGNDDDEEEEGHKIDRFAITEVICRSCYTRQSSKTNRCFR